MTVFYLDLPYIDSIPDPHLRGAGGIMADVGGNTGNLVFRKGLKSILPCVDKSICLTWADLLQKPNLHREASLVLVSCANWLGMRPEDEAANLHRATVIEKFDCPVVAFGLGIQAPHDTTSVCLGPNTLRLAQCLSSKYHSLSVRDDVTHLTLRDHGIDNSVVTGCPSNFITANLGQALYQDHVSRFSLVSWIDAQCAFNEVAGSHPDAGKILFNMLSILERGGGKYFLQTPALMSMLLDRVDELPHIYKNCSPYDPVITSKILHDKSLFYLSVDEWLGSCLRFSFFLGMRIHGAMVSLQAGVPSLLIAHDLRTAGLAKTMSIPAIDTTLAIEAFASGPSLILDMFMDKLPPYLAARRRLATTMVEYLREGDLPVREHLLSIANA